jgi:hypothetical protein
LGRSGLGCVCARCHEPPKLPDEKPILGGSVIMKGLWYFSDEMRHLVCWPYSDENLHLMAKDLGLKHGWFHAGGGRGHRRRHAHYDIPKKRVEEIRAKTEAVTSKELWSIIMTGELPERLRRK